MQVQRVQFNNPYITFKGEIPNLHIDNKNPLITEETREVANNLHKLFKSVEGKTLTLEGLSVGGPVETYLDLALNDETLNPQKVKLHLHKNSRDAKQIIGAELYITENGNPTRKIEYYPKRQINGVWMDDLASYYLREGRGGTEGYNYSSGYELNNIFVKYGREFITKLKKLVKYYK
jgi:hypothetical protein